MSSATAIGIDLGKNKQTNNTKTKEQRSHA
jgi:hypothetical protein